MQILQIKSKLCSYVSYMTVCYTYQGQKSLWMHTAGFTNELWLVLKNWTEVIPNDR